jgi:hypothetical protein
VVVAAVKTAFAGSVGIVAACLMVGLLGVVAVTGRWPVDAPRTHIEARGILHSVERVVARIEFSADEHSAVFSRKPGEGWLINAPRPRLQLPATSIQQLAAHDSAPRRVLAASEYSPDQLAVYGLDPPRLSSPLWKPAVTGFGEPRRRGMRSMSASSVARAPLLPRDLSEEWQLARDTAERTDNLLLPVSIARVWAIKSSTMACSIGSARPCRSG